MTIFAWALHLVKAPKPKKTSSAPVSQSVPRFVWQPDVTLTDNRIAGILRGADGY